MEELTKKSSSTSTDDVNPHDSLFNVKRLRDGYLSIVDKMGYPKFKPYLQRLFHSIEVIITHEIDEFKKIDAKYQDIVRQCHTYEKTLALLKESNGYEFSSFGESSNTYALDDLTKVTPFLAPDLLQSTLGGGSGSTSLQFRLPRQLSSLTNNRPFVSTPLGPLRAAKKGPAPVAQFDDDDYSSSSFILTNSLGFPQTKEEKQFVDAFTEPDYFSQENFACQMAPICIDRDCETTRFTVQTQTTQTETIVSENVACQITPECPTLLDFCIQTDLREEQKHFSCQIAPICFDQASETIVLPVQPQTTQTETIIMQEFACQMTPPVGVDQEIETVRVILHDCASQSSFDTSRTWDDRQVQTESVSGVDEFTQYDLSMFIEPTDTPDTAILPIIFSQEWPMSEEYVPEIPIVESPSSTQDACIQSETVVVLERECQTINIDIHPTTVQCDSSTQTRHISTNDSTSQSVMLTVDHRDVQTEPLVHSYSSSLFIVPASINEAYCSSTIVLIPSCFPSISDQAIQCDLLLSQPITIPIEVSEKKNADRRSLIQQRMDEKEKQMNRIIEEYAMLYGEYEGERRRNMDLTEARDRLADHIKVLSDELGDREITQEKLLIRSGQQSKLINYMLPHIDCSPTPKKKHHSTSSFRRLLPKFK